MIEKNNPYVDRVRHMCRERGIRIEPCGKGFHLVGPGVDLLAADLSQVLLTDLAPAPVSGAGDTSPRSGVTTQRRGIATSARLDGASYSCCSVRGGCDRDRARAVA